MVTFVVLRKKEGSQFAVGRPKLGVPEKAHQLVARTRSGQYCNQMDLSRTFLYGGLLPQK